MIDGYDHHRSHVNETVGEVRPLSRLRQSMSSERWEIRRASLSSVLNKMFDLAPPLLIGAAVDVVVREDSLISRTGIDEPFQQLLFLAVATVIIWVGESFFQYLYQLQWRTIAQSVEHRLRLEAWEHVQKLEMTWFSIQPKGEVMSIINDDVNQLERFLDVGANELLQVITTVVVIGAIFLFISWEVALLAFIPIPIILWGSFRFQKSIEPRYARMRGEVGKLNAELEQALSGIAAIKAFSAEEYAAERLNQASERYREANQDAIRLSAAFVPLIRMAILLGFTATLLLGGWFTLKSELTVGEFSVLVFLTQRLLWPLTRLGETVDLYQRAMASTTRILDLIDTPVDIDEGDLDISREDVVSNDIVFENVDFTYPEREQVLHGLSLTMTSGKTLGLVGSTGSGKTTVAHLLLRFFDRTSGIIRIGEHDVRDLTLTSLRRSISLVAQRVTLFPTTIRENIRYGRPEATDEEVRDAAVIAEAIEFIERLPEGWETEVGEGGQRLSGGQAQRLAIARAVLKDAPILILDEATSSVDNETEAALQRSLSRISEQRTTMIIAHRLSTVVHADMIIVMEQGRICESGTHSDLLKKGGLYRELWAVQSGERMKRGVGESPVEEE